MKYAEAKPGKVIVARLFEDEDLLEAIVLAAQKSKIRAGFFSLIGTLKSARVGFFHKGKYKPIEMVEQLEIVSCIGNVSVIENEPQIHAHIAVSNRRGEVFGGHVLSDCKIGVTGELILVETVDVKLERTLDSSTGLYLWSIRK